MLGTNRIKFWQGSDSNHEPTAWEPCCPKPTAVIYFWIKRVANFDLKKKEEQPYWKNNFSCRLHMRRKITIHSPAYSLLSLYLSLSLSLSLSLLLAVDKWRKGTKNNSMGLFPYMLMTHIERNQKQPENARREFDSGQKQIADLWQK